MSRHEPMMSMACRFQDALTRDAGGRNSGFEELLRALLTDIQVRTFTSCPYLLDYLLQSFYLTIMSARGILHVCQVLRSTLTVAAKDAAVQLLKWGQIMESNQCVHLPSRLHELFFARELYGMNSTQLAPALLANGLAAFVRRVVERMEPQRLRASAARHAEDSSIYERRWQMEFYR